jgi:hypothetical protein
MDYLRVCNRQAAQWLHGLRKLAMPGALRFTDGIRTAIGRLGSFMHGMCSIFRVAGMAGHFRMRMVWCQRHDRNRLNIKAIEQGKRNQKRSVETAPGCPNLLNQRHRFEYRPKIGLSVSPKKNGKKLAEREGFEPSMGFKAHTPLAGEPLQPLGHLSGVTSDGPP